MFIDLHKKITNLKSIRVDDRVNELTSTFGRKSSIVAIGGFPITEERPNNFLWCDSKINSYRIRKEITKGLGLSGTLTFMNKSNLSLDRLGIICAEQDHDWAYHWITISIVFIGYDIQAELGFTRDSRFYMSWPVTNNGTGKVFVATGSLKNWIKFTEHFNDGDFDTSTRLAMKDSYELIQSCLP